MLKDAHDYDDVEIWADYRDVKSLTVKWRIECLITVLWWRLTHVFSQQREFKGPGETLGWAQAVFWCKWSISSPCMFQTLSEGNKDSVLPTYLLRFNTVSVVAVSNTFPAFVFQCQLYPLIVLCDMTHGLEESSG